ncbi:single-stranded DNA-binding protein [Cryobacterium sp. PH29-G1]|uniref:single-stranded DNA-binding protein n=1 Tax=Cryobacterium sp. PH29-G1 TaxID=3046211 RepID=UPI0024BBA8A5|nr:single-stranded DNA-binding protein [Cryobacterium sp. PH29-G1]MDJ0349264.1 single-stranded DNA-binding protein [Cryobacterium sp. PH29-G1]
MNDYITVSGIIGTVPRRSVAKNGAPITSFRLASHRRHFDRAKNGWVDDDSSWYSVTTYRQLAANAGQSLNPGEHVIVTGRLVVRKWTNGERSGIDVEIIADAVGHDLTWYTTTPVRSGAPARAGAEQFDPEPVESAESAESATAYREESEQSIQSEDGFVPSETDADRDSFARLDS